MKRIPKQEYTAEFKEQAVKRADEAGCIDRVAEELGLVEQTLRNWVKAAKAGKLNPAGAKQITAEQMELSRLAALSCKGFEAVRRIPTPKSPPRRVRAGLVIGERQEVRQLSPRPCGSRHFRTAHRPHRRRCARPN